MGWFEEMELKPEDGDKAKYIRMILGGGMHVLAVGSKGPRTVPLREESILQTKAESENEEGKTSLLNNEWGAEIVSPGGFSAVWVLK